jgi:hypothetical protein
MTIQVTRLDSGLTVASDTMDRVETVSLGAWVGVGTRHGESGHDERQPAKPGHRIEQHAGERTEMVEKTI